MEFEAEEIMQFKVVLMGVFALLFFASPFLLPYLPLIAVQAHASIAFGLMAGTWIMLLGDILWITNIH